MTHANEPQRRRQQIEELERQEREALGAYIKEARRRGASPLLPQLKRDWDEAAAALKAAQIAKAVEIMTPGECGFCGANFLTEDTLYGQLRHASARPRVEAPSGRVVCGDCAAKFRVINREGSAPFGVWVEAA